MSSDHPWRAIATPSETGNFNARRIPDVGETDWGLYWAVDTHRQCLLILQCVASHRPSHRLPTLRGLRVEFRPTQDGTQKLIVIRLTDSQHRDIFYQLCKDIVESTRPAKSGKEAVDRVVMRTWRWHRLLRVGRDERLRAEEQKGLIGELLVLERHLLPTLGATDAVRSWVGPLGAPRDFRVGPISLEAKACRPLASSLRISSAEQLDSTDEARLFLHVVEVAEALEDSHSAVTVADVVGGTRDLIAAQDLSAEIDLEERLLAAGFDWAHDYSDHRWMIGGESLFEVAEGFPRITPDSIPPGVENVRYAVALSQCQDFQVQASDLADAVCEDHDGH